MKCLSLRCQLITAFSVVALVTLAVALSGLFGTQKIGRSASTLGGFSLPAVEHLLAAQSEIERLNVAQRTLLSPSLTKEEREQQFTNITQVRERYRAHLDAITALPLSTDERAMLADATTALKAWRELNDQFLAAARSVIAADLTNPTALETALEQLRGDHHAALAKVSQGVLTGVAYESTTTAQTCRFGKWLSLTQTTNPVIKSVIARCGEPHEKLHVAQDAIRDALTAGDTAKARVLFDRDFVPALQTTLGLLAEILDETTKARTTYERMNQIALVEVKPLQEKAFGKFGAFVDLIVNKASTEASSASTTVKQVNLISLVAMVAGTTLALALGIIIGTKIARRLGVITHSLTEGAHQTATAAGQISASSQSLATGSSQQAASLEEASASITEIASMSQRTAEHAEAAQTAASEARTAAETSAEELTRMRTAMDALQTANKEVTAIVKTIDEIAFQTNLLALNASIEAARAGEAGAGFAVVAEEVRALAGRSTEAARDTAQRIAAASEASVLGASLGQRVGAGLDNILTKVRSVDDRMQEIVAAAQQQDSGLKQVQSAVSQMDQITQSNAGIAEEAAAAAEELHSQTRDQQVAVESLHALIEGQKTQKAAAPVEVKRTAPVSRSLPPPHAASRELVTR